MRHYTEHIFDQHNKKVGIDSTHFKILTKSAIKKFGFDISWPNFLTSETKKNLDLILYHYWPNLLKIISTSVWFIHFQFVFKSKLMPPRSPNLNVYGAIWSRYYPTHPYLWRVNLPNCKSEWNIFYTSNTSFFLFLLTLNKKSSVGLLLSFWRIL